MRRQTSEVDPTTGGDKLYGVKRLAPRQDPKRPGSLASVTTIARLAGYEGSDARQRGYQLSRSEGFPAPLDDLGPGIGRIWDRAEVQAWLEANPPRRRAA